MLAHEVVIVDVEIRPVVLVRIFVPVLDCDCFLKFMLRQVRLRLCRVRNTSDVDRRHDLRVVGVLLVCVPSDWNRRATIIRLGNFMVSISTFSGIFGGVRVLREGDDGSGGGEHAREVHHHGELGDEQSTSAYDVDELMTTKRGHLVILRGIPKAKSSRQKSQDRQRREGR